MRNKDIHIVVTEKEYKAMEKLAKDTHDISLSKLVSIAIRFYLKARKRL